MNKHLLVTGGAGFIGANFILHLLSNSDYSITNVDSLTYAGKYENNQPFEKSNRYRFIKCDIGKFDELRTALDQEYEAIINFAAESHVDRSIMDAAPFIHTNIKGTFNLLQAVLSGKARKMIQISTDEVYGSLEPTDPPFIEETPLAPNNPYSASKASADLLVRSYSITHQLPLIITRCSNNYGPMQHTEKFIPKIISNALNDIDIPLYGDGLNIRDWIYVEDHCRAIQMVLEKGAAGEVYNIGGTEEKTNREVIQAILNQLGKDKHLIKHVKDRKGHDRRYSMDSSKISRELGWKPSVSFEDGIKKTIEWFQLRTHERR
ncbi:dTDP-glucose 4,6-dehydratase [Metabacillus sediminilitoris]|uniref:dTDP-glucose 4,6-dehydratase n=1 Tax=Metabacillus sediminilitoris TaxID=2567941 RepID=A0A4S4BUY3_9BACI|nr:dTDP-glucose 4,6-dehydratase [Metabacillus sediminilitoris]QGQ44731.1 dTDP-glucose 4,6-dehydratase [Metabacillus sediminilitoris]THF78921.1 dTDP-glucose 4,6-dehydratase [Metabacillus sediminilitoris]